MTNYQYDWKDLAFGNKKPLRELKATFISAPREMSTQRFKELIKQYLPAGHVVLGVAKEDYIAGFEGQPQFKTLRLEQIKSVVDAVNQKSPNKIYTLRYFQREAVDVLSQLDFKKVVLVNGSWHRSFHLRPEFYELANRSVPYDLVSPFVDQTEAKQYADSLTAERSGQLPSATLDDSAVMTEVDRVAKLSFDTSFQVGAVLAEPAEGGYRAKLVHYNKVVPYETAAMHNGSSREKHFSQPGDLTHYDAAHAEMMLLVEALKQGLSIDGLSLFINVLPCPTCARTLSETNLAEIIYGLDHSDGYGQALLKASGKIVRQYNKLEREI